VSQTLRPIINLDDCTGCVACVDACNPQCLEMDGTVAVLVRPETCTGEGHCVDACPTDAIRMAELPVPMP
jgi:NAD-dependent dihydropyrimidine dehydrogenase PreA subunit